MSPSHTSISLIKQSNMSKERLTIFLLNVPKEALKNLIIPNELTFSPVSLEDVRNKIMKLDIKKIILKYINTSNNIKAISADSFTFFN